MKNENWKMVNGIWNGSLPNPSGKALHYGHELTDLHRLRDMSVVAGRDRPYSILRPRVSSEGNRRHVLAFLIFLAAYLPDQLITIGIRHSNVANQQIKFLGTKQIERFSRRRNSTHVR